MVPVGQGVRSGGEYVPGRGMVPGVWSGGRGMVPGEVQNDTRL